MAGMEFKVIFDYTVSSRPAQATGEQMKRKGGKKGRSGVTKRNKRQQKKNRWTMTCSSIPQLLI